MTHYYPATRLRGRPTGPRTGSASACRGMATDARPSRPELRERRRGSSGRRDRAGPFRDRSGSRTILVIDVQRFHRRLHCGARDHSRASTCPSTDAAERDSQAGLLALLARVDLPELVHCAHVELEALHEISSIGGNVRVETRDRAMSVPLRSTCLAPYGAPSRSRWPRRRDRSGHERFLRRSRRWSASLLGPNRWTSGVCSGTCIAGGRRDACSAYALCGHRSRGVRSVGRRGSALRLGRRRPPRRPVAVPGVWGRDRRP